MLISNNYLYEAVSETVTKPVVAHRAALEFLSECIHKCKGCFVNRTNSYTQHDLNVLDDIMSKVNASGMLFDELVLGPVDIFGSSNGQQLLREPTFIHIMTEYKPILAMPTTFMCDDQDVQDIVDIFNEHYSEQTELEFAIIVDPVRLAARDILYMDELKRKIRILDGLKQPTCYALQLNVRSLNNISMHELSLIAKEEFHTIIDIIPSFFRSGKPETVNGMLQFWNRTLEQQVTEDNKNDIQMVIADHTHSSFNYVTWVLSQGEMYISPFIHEKVIDTTPPFHVDKTDGDFYNTKDLTQKMQEARISQFKYAPKTTECAECKYLPTCISRHALTYMEVYDIIDCVLPKKVLDLYDGNMGQYAYEIYNWDDYTTTDEVKHGNRKHHEYARKQGIPLI